MPGQFKYHGLAQLAYVLWTITDYPGNDLFTGFFVKLRTIDTLEQLDTDFLLWQM